MDGAVPVVQGELDRDYVEAALARAGRPALTAPLLLEPLSGGRSGAVVTRLAAGDRHFVHKAIRQDSPRSEACGDQGRTETVLWTSGLTRDLPAPLRCPNVDVTHHVERGEWWLLMDDVSAGIVPRAEFAGERAPDFLAAMARLHARWWGRADALPLTGPEPFARAVCSINATLARGEPATGWGARWADSFVVVRDCLPRFIEVLTPAQADLYLTLCTQPERWLARLAAQPTTFIHGDLRRANISFLDGQVVLFDWDLAVRTHAAVDLQWWWLLQFWAYPPKDGLTVDDREPLRQHYLGALERELGAIDRAAFDVAWQLGWLLNLTQIGYVIADPLTDPDVTDAVRARVTRTAQRALDWAQKICDDHV